MTAEPTLPTCALHHDRETRLRCARCGRPVCADCLDRGNGAGCAVCADRPAAESAGTQAPSTEPPPGGAFERRPPSGTRAPTATPASRTSGWRATPVTSGLLAAFVAVFVLGTATGGDASPIVLAGAQFNPLVMAGQWWRVLTATLLHAGITHLFFNGYALYVLGPQLERGVGSAAFAALYVASGLAGGLAFLFTSPEQIAVGASGAIFGLFGAWFAASWVNRDTPQGRAGVSQFGVLLLINLALPLFIPNIAWQAHLGGLVVGAVAGAVWAVRGRRGDGRGTTERAAVPAALALVLLAVLLWYT